MFPSFLTKLAGTLTRSRGERRGAKRLAPAGPTPCLLKAPGEDEPISAWIHNLSLKGAGVLVAREYAKGQTLHLLLVNGAHMFALSVEFTVVRSFRAVNGDYFLGGRFTRPLRPDELMPFMV